MSTSVSLQKYYTFHSKIYDWTRWSFLFGRKSLIKDIKALEKSPPKRILEVGCGTGHVLAQLCRNFKNSDIVGVDLSSEMLAIAQNKLKDFNNVTLIPTAFNEDSELGHFDLIIFSYSLSMIADQWPKLNAATQKALSKDGLIAVVDFHQTSHSFFKKWMQVNHVEMFGHFPHWMENGYQTRFNAVQSCYGNLWQYRKWIGQKK